MTPYDTGKVKIGLLYQAPAPALTDDDERVQAALLGIRPPSRLLSSPWSSALVAVAVILALVFLKVGAQ